MSGVDPCARMRLMVQADHDGELEPVMAAEVEAHLAGCAACRAEAEALRSLSVRLRREVPAPDLPAWIAAAGHGRASALPRSVRRVTAPPRTKLRASSAAGMLMLLAVLWVGRDLAGRGDAAVEMVDAHIRALQPGHLMDVASTDRHTVKPWFAGKLDYSPPFQDFAAQGFPLRGGRLDVLGGRTVAALVYARGGHAIDVFVWPGTGTGGSGRHDGFNWIGFSTLGMEYRVVSDLNAAELRDFVRLFH